MSMNIRNVFFKIWGGVGSGGAAEVILFIKFFLRVQSETKSVTFKKSPPTRAYNAVSVAHWPRWSCWMEAMEERVTFQAHTGRRD